MRFYLIIMISCFSTLLMPEDSKANILNIQDFSIMEKDCTGEKTGKSINACILLAEHYIEIYGDDTPTSNHYWSLARHNICNDLTTCLISGWAEYKLDNDDMATSYYLEAFLHYEALPYNQKESSLNYAYLLNNAALLFKEYGHAEDSLTFFKESCLLKNKYACYNIAIVYAKKKEEKKAYEFLKLALDLGYAHFNWLRNNETAQDLKYIEGYYELLNQYEAKENR